MSQQQRPLPQRPNRPGGSPDGSAGNSLDQARRELARDVSSAARALESAGRAADQAQAKDVVPRGTFHASPGAF